MSTSRMRAYVPLIQKFVVRVVLYHTSVAGKLGFHATDLKALQLLGYGSMSAGDLGGQIGLTGAAVTALVDRLEEGGYVVRERGTGDRRRVAIHAVSEKLREINGLYATHHARMSRMLSRYSAEEFRAIADFLARATEMLAEEAAAFQSGPREGRRS